MSDRNKTDTNRARDSRKRGYAQGPRLCEICGKPIDPLASSRRTICDKESCRIKRQHRYADTSYRRRTILHRSGIVQSKAIIEANHQAVHSRPALDRAARLDALRRADDRLTMAALNGGRIPNQRDPLERPDPMEA